MQQQPGVMVGREGDHTADNAGKGSGAGMAAANDSTVSAVPIAAGGAVGDGAGTSTGAAPSKGKGEARGEQGAAGAGAGAGAGPGAEAKDAGADEAGAPGGPGARQKLDVKWTATKSWSAPTFADADTYVRVFSHMSRSDKELYAQVLQAGQHVHQLKLQRKASHKDGDAVANGVECSSEAVNQE